jgi:signal transduction histidine kinase
MRAISLFYPPFLILCTGTALYALGNPAPTGQMMTQEARRRARPFLLASSLVQLIVSVGVALALLAFGYLSLSTSLYGLYSEFADWINAADLVVSLAISVAVMLLGKAIVSYEIFTGKILPRRGFLRQWRAIVTLAACYALLLSGCIGLELRPIFSTLLTTTLMSAFLAIFSARATADHERAVQSIAPFVASQHLTQGLLSGDAAPLQRALDEPFRALCEEVLGASRAVLMARGAHASLCGAPRLYPPSLPLRPEWAPLVANLRASPQHALPLPFDCGMNYLVPLGAALDEGDAPLGALLLGPKRDGGLYTVEEIEVARATGQHLLDSQAGATLAARLVELQRQKLAQVQTLDRRARRALHDDILPLLHGALLDLSAQNASPHAMGLLTDAHKGISDLLREAPAPDSPLARRDFFQALEREVEIEMKGAFASVEWQIAPAARDFTAQLPALLADSLFFAAREAIRNAAKYGRGADETRALNLRLEAKVESEWTLEICDDGVGTGGGASDVGGSGSGLALHAAMLAIAGGYLRVESAKNGGTRVILGLPGASTSAANLTSPPNPPN